MSGPQLVLKRPTGWFAAGREFGEALNSLSDAAFKLYAWLCLNADRHTAQLPGTVPELSSALKKPEPWVELALRELFERGVCQWMEIGLLEVSDRHWPYEKQSRRNEARDYVEEVRRMLRSPACVRCRFTPADELLARDLVQRGVSLEQLQRAIWLGCARKYVAMLNGQPPIPITSLRYFSGLVEEVRQAEASEGYWQHVRSRADQYERQWLRQRERPAVALP
jgi:hypothetical protein